MEVKGGFPRIMIKQHKLIEKKEKGFSLSLRTMQKLKQDNPITIETESEHLNIIDGGSNVKKKVYIKGIPLDILI